MPASDCRLIEETAKEERTTHVAVNPRPRTVRRALLFVVAGLALASALAQVAEHRFGGTPTGLANLFDANLEANFPTFYSALALVLCCCLAAVIGLSGRGQGTSSRWLTVSGLLGLAAIDEAVGLHELLNDPLRDLLDSSGVLSYPWVIPGTALAVAIAVYFRRFVRRLPKDVRRLTTAGALVFVAGALFVESIENLLADRAADPSLAASLVGTLSELLEMTGVVLVLEALLLHIALLPASVSVVIRPRIMRVP